MLCDHRDGRRTVWGMRKVAAALIAEQLGFRVAVDTPDDIDGEDMCAALAWAAASVAGIGYDDPFAAVAGVANDAVSDGIALVVALLDGGTDLAEAASDLLDGKPVKDVCEQLIDVSKLLAGGVVQQRRALIAATVLHSAFTEGI